MTGILRDLTGRRSPGLIAQAHEPEPQPEPLEPPQPAPAPALAPPAHEEPQPGDLVLWHDGSTGIVALARASWIEPGEALVFRHLEQAHHGAPSWLVEAGSLVAEHTQPDGAVVFRYRGSLG